MDKGRMRLWAGVGAVAFAALLTTGLVRAQSSNPPPPPIQMPPADDLPPSEEPPPAPGDIGPNIAPPTAAAPPVIAPPVDEKDKAEDKEVQTAPAPVADAGPPDKRQRHGSAIIQSLDKITAETMRFEVKVGRPVRWKGLVFTVRSCETTAPDEPMNDVAAYVEVRAEPKAMTESQPSRQVFRGWMYGSSPGVSALQHPVYDAWLIACKA